jgi:maltose-binding protein MalE
MISPKGFSINANIDKKKLDVVMDLLKFLLDVPQQHATAIELNTMPTRKEVFEFDDIKNNEILINSELQIERGRAMPVVPELRAVWDAMRPNYQSVLNGEKSPRQAAKDMQWLAIKKINEMNE